MLKKELTVDSFDEVHVKDDAIQDLIKKIEVLDFEHTQTAASIQGKIEIKFKNGEVKTFEEKNSSNSILNSDSILEKFYQNSNLEHDDELVQELLKIEETDDVGTIMRRILNEQITKY
jgi:2-methylcitrate dehydratase PrpD